MPGNLHELRVREMLPRKGVSVGPKRFLHREEDFFITLKPLTYLMRFWGIFSLDTRLHFAILSFSWMWCFLVTMILIVVQVFEKNQELRQLKSPLYISRTVLVGFTTLIYDKDMPDLIVSITKFDATYFKTFNVKEKYGRLSRGSTWLYINFITWAIILSDFFEDEEILYGRFFSYVGRQMSTYLYMFFCIHLIIRFRNLRKKWNHQIQMITNTTFINVEVWEKHLEHSRLLYHYLCTLVIKLSNCYGFKLSVNIMTMFLTILLDLYEYLYVLGEFHMNHTIGTIFEFVTIILICIISGKVTWESQQILQDLYSTPVSNMPAACHLQVRLLMAQVSSHPPTLSLAGFAELNRSTILSIALSMTTYIIVVVQFSSELMKITNKK